MSHRRSEPAGLRGRLRIQITEANKGLFELRRKKDKENENAPREGWGEGTGILQTESMLWVFHLEGFYLEALGEDLNRIFTSFPGVSFQDRCFY